MQTVILTLFLSYFYSVDTLLHEWVHRIWIIHRKFCAVTETIGNNFPIFAYNSFV